MAQKPFETLDLTGKYIEHDVPLYCHGHPTEPDGMNAAVKEIESTLQAFDLDNYAVGTGDMQKTTYDQNDNGFVDAAELLFNGTDSVTISELRNHLDNHPAGNVGDMEKSVYDSDDDGIVDAAEMLDNGSNTVSISEVRDHLDNHPDPDTVGGEMNVSSSSFSVSANYMKGHVYTVPLTSTLTLPNSNICPDNARLDIVVTQAVACTIAPYFDGKSGDRIVIPGAALSYGANIVSSGVVGDCITLRKDSNGWVATQNTGFAAV